MSAAGWRRGGVVAICAPLLLLGCKDEKGHAAKPAPDTDPVTQAAEGAIRAAATSPANTRFRGIQVYRQAIAQRQAVCGQVSPFADDGNIFVPFVSVVTSSGNPGEAARYQFDTRIGASTAEASRVYAAIVAFCYDGGGPAAGQFPSASPTPPLPDAVPDPATPVAAARPTKATAGTPASGTVTVRQSANLRSDPHGASVRVVARGTSLHVFSQAPGGWVQVGDTAPEGWIHESMLDRH
jgi:hypothetical protein